MREKIAAVGVWITFSVGILLGTSCAVDDKLVDVGSATLNVHFRESDFSGNSIRMVGAEDPSSIARDRCEPKVDECINVNEIAPTVSLSRLCPSLWSFQFEIFENPGCQGKIRNNQNASVNVASDNLICLDEADAVTRKNLNQINNVSLVGGSTARTVSCFREWASSSLALTTCAVAKSKPLTLDCGCTKQNNSCVCSGLAGGSNGNLPPNCDFEPNSCFIVCP